MQAGKTPGAQGDIYRLEATKPEAQAQRFSAKASPQARLQPGAQATTAKPEAQRFSAKSTATLERSESYPRLRRFDVPADLNKAEASLYEASIYERMLMNKQKQGQIYRAHTLRLLARLGYASTRQIARAVWASCDESSRKMAGRTVTWLLERGFVVVKRDGGTVNGERLAAVTALGANWLAEHGEPIPRGKAHARDWLRHAHSHRSACNSVYVARCGLMSDDRAVWSELEIRAQIAPLHQFSYTFENQETVKIPDVLARLSDGRYEWIEVENTWRSATDFTKLVEFLRAMFYNAQQTRFACVHLIVTAPGAKSIGARLRKRMTHGLDSGEPRQIKEADARILSQHLKVSTLDHETLEFMPVEF